MPRVNETEVYDALLRYTGEARVNVGNTQVNIRLRPSDIHAVDSPDCLLWVCITFTLFGQEVELKVPIPIEAEKGGIAGGALEDLEKFVAREKYPIEIPMVVVAESGYQARKQEEKFRVRFSINQVPVRALHHE